LNALIRPCARKIAVCVQMAHRCAIAFPVLDFREVTVRGRRRDAAVEAGFRRSAGVVNLSLCENRARRTGWAAGANGRRKLRKTSKSSRSLKSL
jgi:hypothetical protein